MAWRLSDPLAAHSRVFFISVSFEATASTSVLDARIFVDGRVGGVRAVGPNMTLLVIPALGLPTPVSALRIDDILGET